MCQVKEGELVVAAIKNGTVIDHIPSSKLFAVINLLHLEGMKTPISIGYNLKSQKMGSKSIIKVADKFFSDSELNQLSVVAPNVTMSIIRDYKIVDKKKVEMPDELTGIVVCENPKCITNNQPVQTKFVTVDKGNGILKCHYCEKELHIDNAKLV